MPTPIHLPASSPVTPLPITAAKPQTQLPITADYCRPGPQKSAPSGPIQPHSAPFGSEITFSEHWFLPTQSDWAPLRSPIPNHPPPREPPSPRQPSVVLTEEGPNYQTSTIINPPSSIHCAASIQSSPVKPSPVPLALFYTKGLLLETGSGSLAPMLKLAKYTMGVGDRFGRQARAQLSAFVKAAENGAQVIPVWNKSHREHQTIGSDPSSTRAAADAAVAALRWQRPFHVDADHIRLETVDRFLPQADFFTIDVADAIGKPAADATIRAFIHRHPELVGRLSIPSAAAPFDLQLKDLERIAGQYLFAVEQAGRIYQRIADAKGAGNFITEISMDETDNPQTPADLLVILVAISDERIPAQTIAPKFTGRFNKGVDYVGDIAKFEREFGDDLAVLAHAVKTYQLPETLKLSVHSGSDKFSIYAPIKRALARFNAGLHLKTAGTTWLEEVIGLAEPGGSGLALAKEIYAGAMAHRDELCAPYREVIDIDELELPSPETVRQWSAEQFVSALRHNCANKAYNPHLRQLLHVAYKIAAKMGPRYLEALESHKSSVSNNVTENLYQRHLKPLFIAT